MLQADLFAPEGDADLFGPDAPPPVHRPDPDRVRARLERILCEARAASALPWDRGRARLYRTIVPQMALWLPQDEGAELLLAFEREMARLETA